MRIKYMHVENFRGLVDERIEFDESMTVLAGGNGGGKSSLLEAISIMLSWLPAGLPSAERTPMKIRTSDITVGKSYSRLSMILGERRKPDISLALVKRANRSAPKIDGNMDGAKKYASDMRVMLDSPQGVSAEIPVFVHYGTHRNGRSAPLPMRSADRTSVYAKAFDAVTDFGKFSRWISKAVLDRRREMEDAAALPLKAAIRRRDEINRKYASVAAVKRAIADFGDSYCDFSVKDGALFLGSKNVPAASLSDGEKTVIALIADIAMRMAVANPQKKNPLDTSAIILVDELDLHLHPDWQTAIAERLPRIFTNAQFIISSHSPSIMSLAKSLYRIRGDGGESRLERIDSAFGRSPADLLSSVLNASRESTTAAKIAKMYEFIDEGKYAAARDIINELDKQIPDDPEVVRAEYLVRALSARSGGK